MQLKPLGANQTEVTLAGGNRIFFSYETPVASYTCGKYYRTEEKFSRTTERHINAWLAGNVAEKKPQVFFASK